MPFSVNKQKTVDSYMDKKGNFCDVGPPAIGKLCGDNPASHKSKEFTFSQTCESIGSWRRNGARSIPADTSGRDLKTLRVQRGACRLTLLTRATSAPRDNNQLFSLVSPCSLRRKSPTRWSWHWHLWENRPNNELKGTRGEPSIRVDQKTRVTFQCGT